MPIHRWKNLSINFDTGLLVSTNCKSETYDSILVIIDWLIKMVHDELVKVIINVLELADVIMDIIVQHHNLFDSIINNRGSALTS